MTARADDDRRAGRHRRGRVTVRPDAPGPAVRRAGRTEDEALLRRPTDRPEFLDSDPWRSLRILSEFVEGFDALAAVGPAVSVFGSARSKPDSPECELAQRLGAAHFLQKPVDLTVIARIATAHGISTALSRPRGSASRP